MTVHKPTIFFVYGLLVGGGIVAMRPLLGLWTVLIIFPAALVGVWLDVNTKQHGGWN